MPKAQSHADLSRFAIPGAVKCEPGRNGRMRLAITTPAATAHLYLFGAHLTSYLPAGGRDLLWLDPDKFHDQAGGISGGVPICWPWFGAHPTDPTLTKHGFARVAEWMVTRVEKIDAAVAVTMELSSPIALERKWPQPFQAIVTHTIGETLSMELTTTNVSREPMKLREAFHTYFAVGDVAEVSMRGLERSCYLDNNVGLKPFTQGDEALVVHAPVDRVYEDNLAACEIVDPVLERRIRIEKRDSRSTVVWNPWSVKPDLIPDWRHFLCVETANCLNQALELKAGETHRMSTNYRISAGV